MTTHDVTNSYVAVVKYLTNDDYISQTAKDIATNLNISYRVVLAILNTLQRKGYIMRTPVGDSKFIELAQPAYSMTIELIEKGLG